MERRSRLSLEPPAGDADRASGVEGRYVAGDVIGSKYRLARILGQGGMGEVWEARNLLLSVDVAVKLIHRRASTSEARERFLREARAAASLGHPSVVRVFDYGETERGDPFLVMEVLRGGSLADLLCKRRRLPPAYAVQLLLPVADALAEAHERGIVHRDLKPANVAFAQGAVITPKVIDFGIAKLVDPDQGGRSTRNGTVLGSPDYISPEQARARPDVDARTDVWALSVVLYEAVTGCRPFVGENYDAVLCAVVEDEPVPIARFGAGDDALWAILARGLAKSPEDRWPSMRSLGQALAAWAAAQGVETDVTGTSLAVRWPSGASSRRSPEPPRPPAALDPGEAAGHRPGLRADEPPYAPGPSALDRASRPAEAERRAVSLEPPGAPPGAPPPQWRPWWVLLPAAASMAITAFALRPPGGHGGAPPAPPLGPTADPSAAADPAEGGPSHDGPPSEPDPSRVAPALPGEVAVPPRATDGKHLAPKPPQRGAPR